MNLLHTESLIGRRIRTVPVQLEAVADLCRQTDLNAWEQTRVGVPRDAKLVRVMADNQMMAGCGLVLFFEHPSFEELTYLYENPMRADIQRCTVYDESGAMAKIARGE